jgi:hypothetical protein
LQCDATYEPVWCVLEFEFLSLDHIFGEFCGYFSARFMCVEAVIGSKSITRP